MQSDNDTHIERFGNKSDTDSTSETPETNCCETKCMPFKTMKVAAPKLCRSPIQQCDLLVLVADAQYGKAIGTRCYQGERAYTP